MRYARKCDITHEGMNEGWFTSDDTYIKYEEHLIEWCEKKGYADRDEAYEDGAMYYTQWNPDDLEYYWIEVTFKDGREEKTIMLEVEDDEVFQRTIQGYLFKVDAEFVKVIKGKEVIHIQNKNIQ
jgi:hypothetical protein